jgi:hypothetical protein
MKIDFADYDGPTGLYVATGREILPLDSVAGKIALAGGAVQAGIGDPAVAAALQNELDAVIAQTKSA